ncbi:PAS domain-containing protein [Brevundimonas sp. SORGH_AS_0993]|uniref:PAS domain-containing protein n=1 Tax=Brevundimonas sp. SORGH_AS_0993 TaxID=3041794 RepID=UPI002785616B|nr:PAS domain-containing protein [Brevundimonas sp. SORGH_AS_0993]MDQ1154429.1 two-component sensor histidine kinase [Brevundimonas sp. SORGH_AS_0993]
MSDATPAPDIHVTDCLKTVSLDGRLIGMDVDGLCLMQIDDFDEVKGRPWAELWPSESRHLVHGAVARAAAGRVARFNADCPTAKGVFKSWEVSVTPIRNAEGEIIALQSLSQDVTRRERERRENALVSRELSHRIKNLFAVVDSLLHLSARQQEGVGPYVESVRQRIAGLGRAIAFIHPLTPSEVPAAPRTVKGLIEALAAPYAETGAVISIEGDDAEIGQKAVTALAMVLNELVTNAVKYGGLSKPQGRLKIILLRHETNLVVSWIEKNVLDPDKPMTPGFGTNLLDRTVRLQLRGDLSRDWTSNGLVVRLDLPLACLADDV